MVWLHHAVKDLGRWIQYPSHHKKSRDLFLLLIFFVVPDFFGNVSANWAMDHDCSSGQYRDDSEAWYRVLSEPGVELLEGPDADGPKMLEMYLTGKVLYF